MRYKMVLSYDGTSFSGWQIQPNALSIQEIIQEKLFTILREKMSVVASGRTDAGVHAIGQVAHFDVESAFNCNKVLYQLNTLLPKAIRILELEEASSTFHAQRSAKTKIYHYNLWTEPVDDPFLSPFHLHVRGKFSLEKLKNAAPLFVGTHDFASFANVGGSVKTTVRTIFRVDIVPQRGGIRLEFEGNGFLYKMVRNMMGTLLDIAQGKKQEGVILDLFEKKDRRLASRAAPPHPLFLVKVNYL